MIVEIQSMYQFLKVSFTSDSKRRENKFELFSVLTFLCTQPTSWFAELCDFVSEGHLAPWTVWVRGVLEEGSLLYILLFYFTSLLPLPNMSPLNTLQLCVRMFQQLHHLKFFRFLWEPCFVALYRDTDRV